MRVGAGRLLIALVALLLTLPAAAQAEAPVPSTNQEEGTLPSYCRRADPPAPCATADIYYLDQARAAIGLPPYALPANFLAMSAEQQLLILTNLDRIAYSLPPVEGLNSGLDGVATVGAQQDRDPKVSAADLDAPLRQWTSNVAYGFRSTAATYFFWMYRDGYGGGNYDCPTPTSAGCWGHRRNILFSMAPGKSTPVYSMGVGATTDARGVATWGMALAASEGAPTYYYTWAQAVAEGAGTNVYSVLPPVAEKVRLTLRFHGRGKVGGANGLCRHGCGRGVWRYDKIRMHAWPAPGYRFVGWTGCAQPRGAVCTTELEADATIGVRFAPLPAKHGKRAGGRAG